MKTPFEILYLDNHLLVINKPAGMLAQADETGDADVLTLGKKFLKEKFNKPGDVFLGLMHRLDRPVSGVMVLARTSKAAARLTQQFSQHQVEKRYWAIVEGWVEGEGVCEDFLVKDRGSVKIVSPKNPEGKRAKLSWQSVGIQSKRSLLEVNLETGRPHQIRVQLSKRKMPIWGDFRYGAKHAFDGKNLALHCFNLAIIHPTKKERLSFSAKPPKTWKTWFEDQTSIT